jgi:hypothetical protein
VNARTLLVIAASAALAACTEPAGDTGPLAPDVAVSYARSAPVVLGTGGGRYVLPLAGVDLPGTFAFTAMQAADGRVRGQLRYTLDVFGLADLGLADGLADFHGDVTCVSHDPANNRLWVGGVVTQNRSTQPDFAADPVAQVGDDIWFRVVDYGEGASAGQPDRTTFTGFEGGAGIITSQEYCDTQPWPEDDARTNVVVAGNIQVH